MSMSTLTVKKERVLTVCVGGPVMVRSSAVGKKWSRTLAEWLQT